MKLIIVGGHLSPALALIEKLRHDKPEWQLFFVGRIHSMEGDLSLSPEFKVLPKMQVKFISLTTGRLQRKFTTKTIISLAKILPGLIQAFRIIISEGPQLIVSFGSYQAVPVVIAGWFLRVPIITHEQTVEAGLANKIISKFANKVAVSFKESVKFFPKDKTVVTGNPIRLSIFARLADSEVLESFFQENQKLKLVYVTGGSQGSHFINQAVFSILPKLLKNFAIVLQTGDSQIFKDYETGVTIVNKLSKELAKRCHLVKFLTGQDLGAVLNKAYFVISRAGINTVSELAALKKPTIFIPLPFTQKQEQQKNAELLASLGAAVILPQSTLSPEILEKAIDNFSQRLSFYQANAVKARSLVDLDAADKLAAEIEGLTHSV